MVHTKQLIKEWQTALQAEIDYLKRFSSTKISLFNGQLINTEQEYTYYFESISFLKIPIGSKVQVHWGSVSLSGRILSSEGKSLIVLIEANIGDTIKEASISHDPWELLEQLIERLDEIKKDKKKRLRIQRVLQPDSPSKHPTTSIVNYVHELSLRCKYNPVTYVWGPPGTGKTYTLARVALQRYWKGKRILLLSQSNQAVDVLIKEITATAKNKDRFKTGDILRYGGNSTNPLLEQENVTTSSLLENKDISLTVEKNELLVEKQGIKLDLVKSFSKRDTSTLMKVEEKLAKVLERIRKKEIQFVKNAKIVGTTLAKAATDETIYRDEFDLIIVDEASMAYVPQIAFAAALGKRMIICGDFKQLPPIAVSRNSLVSKWLKEDIFYASKVAESVSSGIFHPHLLLLNQQRRMHPAISSFTNEYIYHSLVGDHPNVYKKRRDIVEKNPFQKFASILLDSSSIGDYGVFEIGSKSRINYMHLLLSLQVIKEGISGGMESIGYITPYRAQAELMDAMMEEIFPEHYANNVIVAATVHRFQGSERDMIVFDTVESNLHHRPGMLILGKESERLVNVAITRTKGKFIHIANTDFIKKTIGKQKTIRQLVEHQEQANYKITTKEIGTWIKTITPDLQWVHAMKMDTLLQDISHANSTILFAFPTQTTLPIDLLNTLEKIDKKVKIKVFGIQIKTEKELSYFHKEIPFPVIIIDEQTVWLGHPLSGVKNSRPPSIAVRVKSHSLSVHIQKQMALF